MNLNVLVITWFLLWTVPEFGADVMVEQCQFCIRFTRLAVRSITEPGFDSQCHPFGSLVMSAKIGHVPKSKHNLKRPH